MHCEVCISNYQNIDITQISLNVWLASIPHTKSIQVQFCDYVIMIIIGQAWNDVCTGILIKYKVPGKIVSAAYILFYTRSTQCVSNCIISILLIIKPIQFLIRFLIEPLCHLLVHSNFLFWSSNDKSKPCSTNNNPFQSVKLE